MKDVFNEKDWRINQNNIFGLEKKGKIALSQIQDEILNSAKAWNKTDSVEKFLNSAINVEVLFNDGLSIENLIKENININYKPYQDDHLDFRFDFINRIFIIINLWLYEQYVLGALPALYKLKDYKISYNQNLISYIEFHSDTDEEDFINMELSKCYKILKVLKKPVYRLLETKDGKKSYFFAEAVGNSIDKRIKFLKNELVNCTKKYSEIEIPEEFAGNHDIKSDIFDLVEKAFSFTEYVDPRKHKQILSDEDLKRLINWVCYYFENNFTIPKIDNPIMVVNTNKGNIVYTFMKLFKQINPLSVRPDSLFNLIKSCFYKYRDDNIENLKKQKEPQYYEQLINNKK